MTKKRREFPRPKARKIPLDEVVDFLERKRYEVLKIERLWRHVTATIRKDGQPLFFKMATTIKTSKMTKNESEWNERVNSRLSPRAPFKVPNSYENGFFKKKLFFFISDYFGDQTLADKYPPNSKQLDKWIPQIAQTAYLISQIKYESKEKPKEITVGEYLITSASEWASQVEVSVQSILEVIKNAKQEVKKLWVHGDFVPWHMYELKKSKFGLVDAEHGGYGLQYYDVAYFYIRVRQSLEEEKMAKEFLKEFVKLLPKKESKTFWQNLKPILAQRLMGDYWGASIGPKAKREEELKKCERFKKDLIANRIIRL
jgi:glycosyltransferase involved in cell wall biosynthesis